MTAQPEEKLGIVWMRPGRAPVYFQLPMALAIKKATRGIRFAEEHGYCFRAEKAEHALRALLPKPEEPEE